MSFANRIVRIKKRISKSDTDGAIDTSMLRDVEDGIQDPHLMAAQFINIATKHENAYKIGYPRASSLHKACMRMHCIAVGSEKTFVKKEWSSIRGRVGTLYESFYTSSSDWLPTVP